MAIENQQSNLIRKRKSFSEHSKKILSYIIAGICAVIICGFACSRMNFQAAEAAGSADRGTEQENINGQNPKGKRKGSFQKLCQLGIFISIDKNLLT